MIRKLLAKLFRKKTIKTINIGDETPSNQFCSMCNNFITGMYCGCVEWEQQEQDYEDDQQDFIDSYYEDEPDPDEAWDRAHEDDDYWDSE